MHKLIGGGHDRFANQHGNIVTAVNAFASEFKNLDSQGLLTTADAIRSEIANGAKSEAVLAKTFALIKEASSQTLGMRHFDMQLLGGYALYNSMIAEMKTGEGKTLAATLPAGLTALSGEQTHIVTVNDYLALRDCQWMKPVYSALGITVSVVQQGMTMEEKLEAYKADIVYGTNNQFGFDFLNDNMIHEPSSRLQRSLDFAIVDEVDSILIDEARTPLAISGLAASNMSMYQTCDAIARSFELGEEIDTEISGDFSIDEKTRQIHFSDAGYDKAEKIFAERKLLHDGGLYEAHNLNLMHHLICALRARYLFSRDKDYMVKDGSIMIIDEHTGRMMPGRRWGDGLHQAIEAKEGVKIEPETQSLAIVSIQNYYRSYKRLAGMTGTALTEKEEFSQIYGLEVACIPTHRNMIRTDQLDKVFARQDAKQRSLIEDIRSCHNNQQPVLVGTTTVDASEAISKQLTKENIEHSVLNAKQHESEAHIITQAGMPGKVTISTSMAGRGTDIVLGGNIDKEKSLLKEDKSLDEQTRKQKLQVLEDEWQKRNKQVVAAGGLRVIGTERHESRRIDNQLRGRSGRQGDPGSSVFYLSFEDPLLRIFADAKFSGLLDKLMSNDDEPLEVGMVSRVIEKAQRRMESYNYDMRKQLLEYDDITNDQRKIIYGQRRHILDAHKIGEVAEELASSSVEQIIIEHIRPDAPEEEWDIPTASEKLKDNFGIEYPIGQWLEEDEDIGVQEIIAKASDLTLKALIVNLEKLGEDTLRLQKSLILEVIDTNWREHLNALDHLRQGIGLRGFAQKNPKQEYRRESLMMFNTMLDTIRHDTARILMSVRLKEPAAPPPEPIQPAPALAPAAPSFANAGRNNPCPCGSGKKYKHCHGK